MSETRVDSRREIHISAPRENDRRGNDERELKGESDRSGICGILSGASVCNDGAENYTVSPSRR